MQNGASLEDALYAVEKYGKDAVGKPVLVLDKDGNKLGEVSQSATSIGASKIAGGSVEYSRRFGSYAWVKK